VAARRHSPAVVHLLLQHGANPRTERLLHSAAAASDPSFVEAYPERPDPDRVEVLGILLEAGADVNDMEPDPKGRPLGGALSRRRTMESGTPLHAAVGVENLCTVRFLLEHGADPRAPSWSGHSPLQVAVPHKLEDIVELLKGWRVESAEKMS
jgi:ankyrin repeat protein